MSYKRNIKIIKELECPAIKEVLTSNECILCSEISRLREKVEAAKNCLVCLPIADAVEIVEDTYKILDEK